MSELEIGKWYIGLPKNLNEYSNWGANLKLNLISNCVPKHMRYHLVFEIKILDKYIVVGK